MGGKGGKCLPDRSLVITRLAAHSSTDPFSDFVVGHGEIWSAQLITAVTNLKLKRSGSKRQAAFVDARDVLVVNPTEDGTSVDVDFEVRHLSEIVPYFWEHRLLAVFA